MWSGGQESNLYDLTQDLLKKIMSPRGHRIFAATGELVVNCLFYTCWCIGVSMLRLFDVPLMELFGRMPAPWWQAVALF